METLIAGFIVVFCIFITVDLVYQYRFYKKSLLKQLYQNYLEYYTAMKRPDSIKTTHYLTHMLGYNRIVFGQDPNFLGMYIIIIFNKGIALISLLSEDTNRYSAKESFSYLRKLLIKIKIPEVIHADGMACLYYAGADQPKRPQTQHVVYVDQKELVQRVAGQDYDISMTDAEIEWIYKSIHG